MTKNNKSKDAKQRQYKNEFVVNRAMHNKTFTYTTISNFLVRDERLNATEKGLMLMILSNNESEYILNMKKLQKQSGLGKDVFYKSSKHLQELGYINKKGIKGGIRWTINEIPKIVIIDITPTSTEISPSWNDKIDNPTSTEISSSWNINNTPTSTEISSTEISPLSNTVSQPSAPTRGKDGDFHLRKTFGDEMDVESVTLSGVCAFSAPQTLHTPTVVGRTEDIENDKLKGKTPIDNTNKNNLNINTNNEMNTQTPMINTKDNSIKVENELELIINNTKFGTIYNNNTTQWGCWKDVNITNMTNASIANAVYQDEKGTPLKDIPNSEYNKTANMLKFVVRYAEDLPNSEIWKEYARLKKIKPKVTVDNNPPKVITDTQITLTEENGLNSLKTTLNVMTEDNTPKIESDLIIDPKYRLPIERKIIPFEPVKPKNDVQETNPDDYDLPF